MAQILVAEDEKDIRELVGFTLKLAGHEVRFASNGQEVLDLIKQGIPDLILMDLRMPVLGGKEAAEVLKKDPQTSSIPIIYLTARDQDPTITGQISNGAEYIAKPFSIEMLNKKVSEVLARHSS
jgi:CheY-like chemotaxis protein